VPTAFAQAGPAGFSQMPLQSLSQSEMGQRLQVAERAPRFNQAIAGQSLQLLAGGAKRPARLDPNCWIGPASFERPNYAGPLRGSSAYMAAVPETDEEMKAVCRPGSASPAV